MPVLDTILRYEQNNKGGFGYSSAETFLTRLRLTPTIEVGSVWGPRFTTYFAELPTAGSGVGKRWLWLRPFSLSVYLARHTCRAVATLGIWSSVEMAGLSTLAGVGTDGSYQVNDIRTECTAVAVLTSRVCLIRENCLVRTTRWGMLCRKNYVCPRCNSFPIPAVRMLRSLL